MKGLVLLLTFTGFSLVSLAQPPVSDGDTPPPVASGAAQDQDPVSATQPADDQDQSKTSNDAQRSVLEVQKGHEVIKDKDLWEKTGYFHPFVRMPKYIIADQKAIWTSPFHTAKSDIKWWLILGGTTGALIATDRLTSKNLPNTSQQVRLGNYTSNLGAAYSLIPLSAGFYFLGTASKSERFRETGMLAFEALIDSTAVEWVLKSATDRARPLDGDGKGHFWSSTGVFNGGFPSGHAINTFALASVFAHQYPHPIYVPVVVYSLASLVVVARVGARRHFPGDVVAGAAMGWFIGDFIYGKRHNSELDHKPTISQRVLDHVRIGVSLN